MRDTDDEKDVVEEILQPKTEQTLIPLEKYLESGVHIGSKFKCGDMRKFIYKHRADGLSVLDISALNRRIKTVAKFLARYPPEKVLIIAGRTYAQKPARKLAEIIGAKHITERFVPGTLTNPSNENFVEPEVVFAADPPVDRQAIKEAATIRVPVVSLADTSNSLKNIDLCIPANNKGKKALALVYWLIARESLKERGIIKTDEEFTPTIEDFEAKVIEEPRREEAFEKRPFEKRFDKRPYSGRGGEGRRR